MTTQARAVSVGTASADETRQLAAELAGVAAAGDRIALIGPLGAGKTQFAKGFARGLGIADVVNSPSFTLMAEYAGRLSLFHQDLYRLGGAAEALAGGLLDERQEAGITLTEWADRLEPGLDPDRLAVRFVVGPDEERRIEISTADPERHARYLLKAAAWAARGGAGGGS
ncbi:MAG: tRNA (adenosine(37)-N6)-threonylcarbamoyltransferase complex ATPase subunit type 1 TsaE [Chloroflexi bacterium]|nr:tRNA (adenosine(37)-N6)-threonylcarbamoyltransferase complex ATPase subunit type 1 TsaE [Chloroflexota bacterium]MDQ3407036.1 tRNA (adenosine(37)-N6)-threonylcarbamoyltransferase complex ATPase subunit type 1 TsaE [Chloroflexota bacterium]